MTSKYKVTSPDGKQYVVTGPDNASHEEVLAQVQGQHQFDNLRNSAPSEMTWGETMMNKIHDAVFVPKGQEDKTAGFGSLTDAVTGIPQEIGKDFMSEAKQFRKDVFPMNAAEFQQSATDTVPGVPGSKGLLDLAGMAASPLTGAATSLIGRPVEAHTGVRREIPGNLAALFVPGVGEEKTAATALKEANSATEIQNVTQAATKSAKAASAGAEDKYANAVKALQKEGVELTAGQVKGGAWRRAEEAHKSNPLVGGAIRDSENKAITSFNKAAYNRALAPIGEKYTGSAVGRDALKEVGNKISARYEKIKPQLKLVPDDDFVKDLTDIRGEGWKMPAAQEAQLEGYINNRILKRVGQDNSIDGETFKQIEGELTNLAGNYKSSSDAAQRELGKALEDLNGALRDNLERHAPPAVREELKNLNTAWATLRRVEGASANRVASGGVFTTGDLLSAIKRADKTSGKRAFSRGDALLQDFADTAHTVLPNRLPDSGTTERQMFNKPESMALWAAGNATNPMAARVLRRMSGQPNEPLSLGKFVAPSIRANSAQSLVNQLDLPDQQQ